MCFHTIFPKKYICINVLVEDSLQLKFNIQANLIPTSGWLQNQECLISQQIF